MHIHVYKSGGGSKNCVILLVAIGGSLGHSRRMENYLRLMFVINQIATRLLEIQIEDINMNECYILLFYL